MKNKIVNNITPGGERSILANSLPLETPFLVQIFPVYACNFKCEYCLYALPRRQHGHISDEVYMDINVYKKCIDDIANFKSKLKMLRFAGIGEPLMRKDIAEMVSYAKQKDVAISVDIVTNGALLNRELSLELIEAGLDRLRISIQGVSSDKYKSLSNVNLNLDNFIDNIKFFYENKRDTKVYIKIIDCALSSKEEEKLFYELFEPICDMIAIEHLTPTVDGIDYEKLVTEESLLDVTQCGLPIIETNICPQPFYMMQINPDGNVVPCCSTKYPKIIGNVKHESVCNIWNQKSFSDFRKNMLEGVQQACDICSKCSLYKYGLFKEDILDDYTEKLKGVFK